MESRFELNGICYDLKSDGTAAVVGYVTDAPKILALRKTVFTNGQDFFVKSISGLGYWNGVKLAIPRTVEFIGAHCFWSCSSLREVIFESDSNLKRIDNYAFSSCGLQSVRIPSKVEFIGEYCFHECKSLSEVIFESDSNLKRIDKFAFHSSGLKSVRIPSKVEFIGECSFYECKSLSEVIFEGSSSLREIQQGAFRGSAVRWLEIPENCNVLDGALVGVKSVSMSNVNPFFCAEGEMILSINEKKLIHYFGSSSRIVLPKFVEFLGEYCFCDCKSLSEVIFESDSNLKGIDKEAFCANSSES
jgi:hypothetical protein